MQVQTAGHRFAADSTTTRFFAEALDRVRSLPGVVSAGLVNQLPLSGDRDEFGAHFEAGPTEAAKSYNVFRYAVSPGYLETMGIPLRRGRRTIVGSDQRVAGAPSGPERRSDRPAASDRAEGRTALHHRRRRRRCPPSLPRPDRGGGGLHHRQPWRFADNAMSLVVRTTRNPAALAAAVRDAIWSVDRDQAIVRVATMEDLVATSAAERRFALMLFEAFALAALVLAAAGIYGVMSASVAERTREIGVRSALGASRGSVLLMVVREGMTLAGLGVALGLGGAILATRAIAAMLFGVSRLESIEDWVQSALLRAMRSWPLRGIPPEGYGRRPLLGPFQSQRCWSW